MNLLWLMLPALALDAVGQEAKPAPTEACGLSWMGPGTYTNLWGFALLLPAGRKAYSNSPVSGCGDDMVVMGDHGIIIPLSTEPSESERFVEVHSGYNAAEEETVAQAADSCLRWVEERAVQGTVRVLRRSRVALDRLAGIRILARYQDRKSGREMVEDALEFLRPPHPKKGTLPEYHLTIYLRCPEATYASDVPEFERLLSSVRFTKPQK